jgi:hypothetical protein
MPEAPGIPLMKVITSHLVHGAIGGSRLRGAVRGWSIGIQAGPGGPASPIVSLGIVRPVKGTLRDCAPLRSSLAFGGP